MSTWARAEEMAIRREEIRGLRRRPIASQWAEIQLHFEHTEVMASDEDEVTDSLDEPLPDSPQDLL